MESGVYSKTEKKYSGKNQGKCSVYLIENMLQRRNRTYRRTQPFICTDDSVIILYIYLLQLLLVITLTIIEYLVISTWHLGTGT